jgi:hypothetical protein
VSCECIGKFIVHPLPRWISYYSTYSSSYCSTRTTVHNYVNVDGILFKRITVLLPFKNLFSIKRTVNINDCKVAISFTVEKSVDEVLNTPVTRVLVRRSDDHMDSLTTSDHSLLCLFHLLADWQL